MDDEIFATAEKKVTFSKHSPRDILTIAFRRRRLLIGCAVTTVVFTVLGAWLLPRYKAEAKLMVQRQRVDPVLTPSQEETTFQVSAMPVVTDEELKSEVDMLTSYDLERDVIRSAHPEQTSEKHPFAFLFAWKKLFMTKDELEAAQIQKLDADLEVDAVKGSDTILVEYKNHDRAVAKRVLDRLVELYLQRNLQVHRPQGQYDFFEKQTDQYKKSLDDAEAKLSSFPATYGVVDPQADLTLVLQKLDDFKFTLHQTEVAISNTQDRIRNLTAQLGTTPDRITTQMTRGDNPQLMEQLKGTLLTLELKRIDLLTKFKSDYRPVQEVDKQLADTKAAIQAQETAPVQALTTDIDPTHAWVVSEMAKAQADMAGLQATKTALERTVATYETSARDLDKKALIQHDLQREATSEENKYLMYQRKREEARVDDALDKQRMLNVAVEEYPTVPALPSHSPLLFAGLIFSTMCFMSIGLFWALEYYDPTLRTSSEVESYLRIPVFAAIPTQMPFAINGNGHGNGNGNGHSNGNGNGNGHGHGHEVPTVQPKVDDVLKYRG
jgi:protein tyrosine kinase modulator